MVPFKNARKKMNYRLWSELYTTEKDKLLEGKGIYILFGKGEGEVTYPFDADPSKILYIGKAEANFGTRYGIVNGRRNQKVTEINEYMGKSSSVFNHHCLYYILDIQDDGTLKFTYRTRSEFGNGYLKGLTPELMLIHYSDLEKIKHDEKSLLMAFRNSYGSLPPFNSTGPSFMDVADCDLNPEAYDARIKPAEVLLSLIQTRIRN